jgi:hypothetical protein
MNLIVYCEPFGYQITELGSFIVSQTSNANGRHVDERFFLRGELNAASLCMPNIGPDNELGITEQCVNNLSAF